MSNWGSGIAGRVEVYDWFGRSRGEGWRGCWEVRHEFTDLVGFQEKKVPRLGIQGQTAERSPHQSLIILWFVIVSHLKWVEAFCLIFFPWDFCIGVIYGNVICCLEMSKLANCLLYIIRSRRLSVLYWQDIIHACFSNPACSNYVESFLHS